MSDKNSSAGTFAEAIAEIIEEQDKALEQAIAHILGKEIYISQVEFVQAAMNCIRDEHPNKVYKTLAMLCLKKLETLGYSEPVGMIRDTLRKAEELHMIYPGV